MTNHIEQMNLLNMAKEYHGFGLSVIPCRNNKKPVTDWNEYTITRADTTQLDNWFSPYSDYQTYQSIGLILGAISRNMVVVDLDGIPAIRRFAAKFPQLCEDTRSVLTGSQEGIHLYFTVDNLPNNANVRVKNVGGFELRGNGQYVIAPPSRHPSGNRYRVYRSNFVLHRDNLNDVYDWMQSLRENEQVKRQADIASAAKPVNTGSMDKRKEAYLQKVLSEEVARVSTSGTGNRNNSLFYAGLRLANFAAAGELDWTQCESMLLLATELPLSEAQRTLNSAYRIGSKNPKVVK